MWDCDIFEPKLFVDYCRKWFDLETSANEQVNTIIPSNHCGHNLKATNGWNRPEILTATKQVLDEIGVVKITCFHSVNLRLLNIYGGGELQSHGIRLIDVVLHVVPHLAELKLCYDVACVFESALYHYTLDWMEVVEARIGRSHIYGHEYRCNVLYNLLHTENYGLMVGEEPEQLWCMMQHLIWSGRVSSSFRRMPKNVSFGRYLPI
jgi:hypothetical protein